MKLISQPRSLNVLLVDDSAPQALLVDAALEEVPRLRLLKITKDGHEALRFLRRKGEFRNASRPDLILMDINMPELGGFETLGEIRNTPGLRRIPVVMLTSSAEEADIANSYERGANSYIVKPMRFDEMVSLFENLANYWAGTAQLPVA